MKCVQKYARRDKCAVALEVSEAKAAYDRT